MSGTRRKRTKEGRVRRRRKVKEKKGRGIRAKKAS